MMVRKDGLLVCLLKGMEVGLEKEKWLDYWMEHDAFRYSSKILLEDVQVHEPKKEKDLE